MKSRLALLLILALLALSLTPARSASAKAESEDVEKGTTEFIFKVINFLLVLGLLVYFLRQPMQRFFAGQRAAIHSAIEKARQARAHSQQRLEEVERRLARLEQESEKMRKEAADNAAAEKQRIHAAARREAERILSITQAEINSATRAARLELRAYTARLAVDLAEQRLQQQLTPKTHVALFHAFVSDFSAPTGSAPGLRASAAAGRNRRH